MPDSEEHIDLLGWAHNLHLVEAEAVPIHVGVGNWGRVNGEPSWSADLLVRFDGHLATSVELVVTRLGDTYRAEVHGIGVPHWQKDFLTFHAAQLAAEERAIEVTHQIPETAS